jgi:hypothetical protein
MVKVVTILISNLIQLQQFVVNNVIIKSIVFQVVIKNIAGK